jgi:peptide deformylase
MEQPELDIEVIERMRKPEPELLRDAPTGEVLPIVFWPDERLNLVSDPVPPDFIGEKLDKLVADMVYTMYMCGGMGLSAIQVGVPLRVFVCDITALGARVPGNVNQLLVAVNPVIVVPKDVKMVSHLEGCLSFPGVHEVVERPDDVALRARDRRGTMYTIQTGGMLGRVIQHELDHLDGKTYLDRMKPLARANAEKGMERFHRGIEKGNIRIMGHGSQKQNPRVSHAARRAARKKRKAKRR